MEVRATLGPLVKLAAIGPFDVTGSNPVSINCRLQSCYLNNPLAHRLKCATYAHHQHRIRQQRLMCKMNQGRGGTRMETETQQMVIRERIALMMLEKPKVN